MTKKPVRHLALALISAAFTAVAPAQTPKICYVNSEEIINNLPEAQAVKKDLETTIKGWQDQLQQMSDDFQKGVEDYQKKQAVMTPTAKDVEEKRLADARQKALDFQNQKFGQNGEAAQLQETKMKPIRDKVLKAIESVAKEEGFNFVLDKATGTPILYADAKFDLTYKVLDRLKRGSAATKSTK